MQMNVQINVFSQVKRLEQIKGKPYNNVTVAKKTGLSRLTINKLMAGETARIDVDTISALLRFFRDEGMEVTISDLFAVEYC